MSLALYCIFFSSVKMYQQWIHFNICYTFIGDFKTFISKRNFYECKKHTYI